MNWLIMLLLACGTDKTETNLKTETKTQEKVAAKTDFVIIAEINGEGVTTKDLTPFTLQHPPKANGLFTDEEKRDLLEKLIDHKLMLAAAMTANSHRDLRIRKHLKSLLIQKEVKQKVNQSKPTESDLQQTYTAHKTSIDKESKGFEIVKSKVHRKWKSLRMSEESKALLEKLKVGAQIELAPDRFDENATGPVATVNGSAIIREDFNRIAERSPKANDTWNDAEKQKLIDRLVEDELYFLEAVKQELFKNPKAARSIINHYVTVEIADKIPAEELSDEKIKARYEKEKDKIYVPAMVSMSRIVVKDQAAALAISKSLIASPNTFEETAKEKTIQRERAKAGNIGWVTAKGRGDVTKNVAEAAFKLENNAVSKPIQSPIGWQIVKRHKLKPKETYSFEKAKPRIKQRMIHEKGRTKFQDMLKNLRTQAAIEIDEQALSDVELKGPQKTNAGALTPENFRKMNIKK